MRKHRGALGTADHHQMSGIMARRPNVNAEPRSVLHLIPEVGTQSVNADDSFRETAEAATLPNPNFSSFYTDEAA